MVYLGNEGRDLLRDIIFINPNWLTEQVYQLINPRLQELEGVITPDYLEEVFPGNSPYQKEQFLELLQQFGLIFQDKEDSDLYIAPQYLPDTLSRKEQRLIHSIEALLTYSFVFQFSRYCPENVMINFLSTYGQYSNNLYWKQGIHFSSPNGGRCLVKQEGKTLTVKTEENQRGMDLAREVCQAFVSLSRRANAAISLDGEHFVSWHKLEKEAGQGFSDVETIDGKTRLQLIEFAHFLGEKGHYLRQKQALTLRAESKSNITRLIEEARLEEALKELEIYLPEHLIHGATTLRGRLSFLERGISEGTLSADDINLERNKISKAVLTLLSKTHKHPQSKL